MRLGRSTLALANNAKTFAYDRSDVKAGIVHLGIGNFHRAHQAIYVDHCLMTDPQWGIVGVSLRRGDMAEALNPQDGLYGVITRDGAGTAVRIIGSVLKVLSPPDGMHAILVQLAAPEIRIVSLTVTEKGYCHDPATGVLNAEHPEIVADFATPHSPRSVPGILVEALRLRKAAGHSPFTVVSCDNLPANGRVAKRVCVEFAKFHDVDLAQWIEAHVAFPCSMVDRIVPSTIDADRQEFLTLTGLEDHWPVSTEPFSQWVLEDRFPSGRPDFVAAGVELVDDVAPYEQMKLRLLNGAHSTLAYFGQLLGQETVFDAMRDPALSSFVLGLWRDEIAPTLQMDSVKSTAYAESLRSRFLNLALKHKLSQIAMDGSQKIPQRLLNTIRDRISVGRSYERLAGAVAAWLSYVAAFQAKDPLSEKFLNLKNQHLPNLGSFA